MCLFISRANMIHLFSLLLTKDMLLSLSCPVDYEILGPFEYSGSKTTAAVRFQAHKFPYTASVYYQCNVQLCIKNANGCASVVSTITS